eukprot:snap_masked-scaffold_42-processed-gene-2.5-mRNA-1 protein AED:1.00 eAED:1.00 QI:0/-1/0/0/-1/1/1/0/410
MNGTLVLNGDSLGYLRLSLLLPIDYTTDQKPDLESNKSITVARSDPYLLTDLSNVQQLPAVSDFILSKGNNEEIYVSFTDGSVQKYKIEVTDDLELNIENVSTLFSTMDQTQTFLSQHEQTLFSVSTDNIFSSFSLKENKQTQKIDIFNKKESKCAKFTSDSFFVGGKGRVVEQWNYQGKKLWTSKGLPRDEFGLNIPIWTTSIDTVSENLVVCVDGYTKFRLYDIRASKEAQIDISLAEEKIFNTSFAHLTNIVALNKEKFIVSDNRGNVKQICPSARGIQGKRYGNVTGEVDALEVFDEEVFVGGLDRWIRSFDVSKGKLTSACYVKQSVTSLKKVEMKGDLKDFVAGVVEEMKNEGKENEGKEGESEDEEFSDGSGFGSEEEMEEGSEFSGMEESSDSEEDFFGAME